MKQLTSLAWKEWHEIRAYFWIAIGIFIGLPLIGGIEQFIQVRRFDLLALPWVMGCGAVLAVFVAVGTSCRDFHSHLEDFWRSRPVSVGRWLLVKYVIGLATVLGVCMLPLALELAVDHDSDVFATLITFPFLWMAMYSVGFLAGCVVRRPAHAAMLALAAGLLVYFLPMILPPLGWLDMASVPISYAVPKWNNSWSWRDGWPALWLPQRLAFAAGMLAIGAIALASALFAVKRDWRIESGRKMMYGSVSCAVLVLFSSAAFRLGTNLPVLQQIDLPKDEGNVRQFEFTGDHGYIVLEADLGGDANNWIRQYTWHRVDLTASGLSLGPGQRINELAWGQPWAARSAEHPDFAYELNGAPDSTTTTDNHFYLGVYDLGRRTKTIQLSWQFENDSEHNAPVELFAWNNRLYLWRDRLLTFDITDPASPTVISDTPMLNPIHLLWIPEGDAKYVIALPPLADLPPVARLTATIRPNVSFDGQTLCDTENLAMAEYRVTNLTETSATLEKVAQYKPVVSG